MTNNDEIWIMLDSRGFGGIESHVLQLAVGLNNHKQKVVVVFLTDYGQHPLRDALAKQKVDTLTLDGRVSTLWKTIRAKKPSVLHTHGYKAGILGRLVARLQKIPVATTYHAGEIATGKLAI